MGDLFHYCPVSHTGPVDCFSTHNAHSLGWWVPAYLQFTNVNDGFWMFYSLFFSYITSIYFKTLISRTWRRCQNHKFADVFLGECSFSTMTQEVETWYDTSQTGAVVVWNISIRYNSWWMEIWWTKCVDHPEVFTCSKNYTEKWSVIPKPVFSMVDSARWIKDPSGRMCMYMCVCLCVSM